MASIYDNPPLTPAQLVKKAVQEAEERARQIEWNAYQEERERFLLANTRQYGITTYEAHGKLNTYKYWGCRCEKCRAANIEYHRQWRKNKGETPRERKKRATHGTNAKYALGCRCEKCRAASLEYHRQWRKNKGIVPRERKKRAKTATHGTNSKYALGCRCDRCREAHKEAQRKLRGKHGTDYRYLKFKCRCKKCKKAHAIAHRGPNYGMRKTITHGTPSGYDYHKCRCEKCTEAHRLAKREYRMKRRLDNQQKEA